MKAQSSKWCVAARHFRDQTLTTSQETPTPLSLDDLNAALVGAQEEVRSPRRQYDQLLMVVAGQLGTQAQERSKSAPTGANTAPNKCCSAGPELGAIIVPLPPCDAADAVPAEIARLSESEAKGALSVSALSLLCDPRSDVS